MKRKNDELQLLYIQFYNSIIFIIAIIVSLILTYNNISKEKEGRTLFSKYEENNITLCNRIILTIVTIIFVYINYSFYEASKKTGKNSFQGKELFASLLTLIAGFIFLYTTVKSVSANNQNASIDTPLI